MKKYIVIFFAMLLMLCAVLPCFAEKPAVKVDFPVIRMEQQIQEYRTPQGQVCIVTDYSRVIVENAEVFPDLAKGLEEQHNKKWASRLAVEARDSYENAVELKKYRPEDYMHFLLEERIWQRYLNQNILSLYVEFYQSRMGAHPVIDVLSFNFEPSTGRLLTLSDVLAPGQRETFMNKAVNHALEKFQKDSGLNLYDNYLVTLKSIFAKDAAGETPLAWTRDEDGITLYFSPDTLAPRVIGPVEGFVPFKGNEKLFNKKYFK